MKGTHMRGTHEGDTHGKTRHIAKIFTVGVAWYFRVWVYQQNVRNYRQNIKYRQTVHFDRC